MLNVGLRSYLWHQKSDEAKVFRELWYLNGTYHAYRNFIANAKEIGFPDQQAAWVARQITEEGVEGGVELSAQSRTSSKASSGSQAPAPYTFVGAFDCGWRVCA